MGRVGSALDNAAAESFFSTLEHELLSRRRFSTRDQARAEVSAGRLERVRLAYLSACNTAFAGRADLLDGALHLASAFQLAGFPQVIGTLWEIDDQFAVAFANDF